MILSPVKKRSSELTSSSEILSMYSRVSHVDNNSQKALVVIALILLLFDKSKNSAKSILFEKVPEDEYLDVWKNLTEIKEECSVAGWDDTDTPAIESPTFEEAKRFLSMLFDLKDRILMPELSPDPQGGIVFEWKNNTSHTTISVNGTGKFYLAFIRGNRELTDVITITNTLPQNIFLILIKNFKRYF